ncbi:MAG: tetratricopeptide repeat protein [Cyanobacteria bacterium P01_H01_bin.35]
MDILNLNTQLFNFFPLAFVNGILNSPVINLVFLCAIGAIFIAIVGNFKDWFKLNTLERWVAAFVGGFLLALALYFYNQPPTGDSSSTVAPSPTVSPTENNKSPTDNPTTMVDPSPPVSPENLKEKARDILRKDGKFGIDKAKEIFLEAKQIDSEDPEISYYLGWLDDLNYSLFKKGECESASDRYKETMELFEKRPPQNKIGKEMVIEIGHFLSNRDTKHREAIDLYDEYVLDKSNKFSDPITYMALVSRGMAYFWLKDSNNQEYAISATDFENALAEKPSSQVAYNRGSVYAMDRNYNKAINYYRAALPSTLTIRIKFKTN